MSSPLKIQGLIRKKEDLELQLRLLEEREKALKDRATILEEKLVVQEMERQLECRSGAVKQLESRLESLEQQLRSQPEITTRQLAREPKRFRFEFQSRT